MTPEQLEVIKAEAERRGYRLEDGAEEVRLYRPDGSLAIVARRPERTRYDEPRVLRGRNGGIP